MRLQPRRNLRRSAGTARGRRRSTDLRTSNGIPPTSGVNLINNAAPGGPKENRVSTANQNLDGALCLRALATGKDAVTGAPLGGAQQTEASRIAEGVEDVLATGRLRRVPAVFVTGRNDGILPPNFTSRAYFGLNNVVEGSTSSLRYYEVKNAHHLDTLNAVAGYGALYPAPGRRRSKARSRP